MIDYLVIAISPVLIITMIGSLVFFLLEVFYRGQHDARLHMIFGLFVFAAVLIGRIAIEEGKERAHLFAAPLAIVTFLALQRYVQIQGVLGGGFNTLWNVLLIALIWWCAHKLTWDCTLIDETERDSGEGLLESAGLDRPHRSDAESSDRQQQEEQRPEGTTSRGGPKLGWWERFAEQQRRPHAPGVWVVYFSLAALPLFGVGQMFIPADREASRQHAFALLIVYVASGLGLLLTTSFLGLRRYLRQRRVEMPAAMTGLWLVLGGALIVVLLLVVDFLPRPDAEYSIAELPFTIGSPDRRPSRMAVGRDGVEDKDRKSRTLAGDAKRQSDGRPQQSPDGEPSQDGSGDADSPDDKSSQQGDSRQVGSEKGDSQQSKTGDSGQKTEQDGSEDPKGDSAATKKLDIDHADGQPPPASSDGLFGSFAWLKRLFRWLLWAVLALVGLYWLWRSWPAVVAGLRDFWQGLRELWGRLFGGTPQVRQAAEVVDEQPRRPLRPFAAFADPFAAGTAARLSPDELVRYSFEALEAWAREHDCPRNPDQTPHEFAREVGGHTEQLSRPAQRLADLYCRVAYAPGSLSPESTDPLKRLWRRLRRTYEAATGGRAGQ